MLNSLIIIAGKLASKTAKLLNLGHGSTWPGHLALMLNPHFVRDILRNSHLTTIVIGGTNGKTTSSLMLRTILENEGKTVIHNESGANLMNGIASTLILRSNLRGQVSGDYAVFETDENALPKILPQVRPDYVLLLNLFRDQLDRYGEIATIAEKWKKAFEKLPETTILVVNADDPRTAFLGMDRKNTAFFGLTEREKKKTPEHDVGDSLYCPRCTEKLTYRYRTYSHLGDWYCSHCSLRRPDINISENIKLSLNGTYNKYNAHGIITLSRRLGTDQEVIANTLRDFNPAFGRQEKIRIKNKTVQLFLSKNPTGFNESLHTIAEQQGKHIMFVLNDDYADGTDVSWIWDTDIESYLHSFKHITISGIRWFDMALRLKYAASKPDEYKTWLIEEDRDKAVSEALRKLPEKEILYIVPTYTAMLEVRKVLTGRKIL